MRRGRPSPLLDTNIDDISARRRSVYHQVQPSTTYDSLCTERVIEKQFSQYFWVLKAREHPLAQAEIDKNPPLQPWIHRNDNQSRRNH